jgi:hypothetical protein
MSFPKDFYGVARLPLTNVRSFNEDGRGLANVDVVPLGKDRFRLLQVL